MQACVSLVRCADYDGVAGALDRILADLGGLAQFVRPGQTVLVKPNLLTDGTPEQAKTTHPEVVRALIRRIKAAGATPQVGDSPANVMDLARVWETSGFAKMCAEEAVPLLNFEKSGSEILSAGGFTFHVAKAVLTADVIINVPKVKTHALTVLTGAVKNMYGVLPGFQKTALHKQYARPDDFGDLLSALYSRVKPALSIVDGVVGMEGNGPSAGRPCQLGFLAGAVDAVALDAVLCDLLGIRIHSVPYFRALKSGNLGVTERKDIELRGDSPDSLRPARFQLPVTLPLHLIPRWMIRPLQPLVWIRPRITDRCVRCGKCVRACPAEALRMEPGDRPVLRPALCIECCCCHEVCPERAIEMRGSFLLRLLRRKEIP